MTTSLYVPLAYITVLVTSLAIFSRVYRRRKAAQQTSYESWFPPHAARDTYTTLLSASPPVPDSLLKTALLCRAVTDVKRIWRVRDDKPALSNLHQRGLVGDETMARFAQAEKELEAEIVDVVAEANTFRPGWGGMIFATATEMAHAERNREIVMSVPRIKMAEEKKLNQRRRFLPEDKLPKVAQPVAPNPAQQAAMLAQMQAQAQAQAQQHALRGASPQPALPTATVPSAETPSKGSPGGLNTPASTGKTAVGGGQSAASTPSKSATKKKGKKK